MKNKTLKDWEDKWNKNKKILLTIYLILILSLGYFAFSSFKYHLLYDEAIKQGSEGIIFALELSVACQRLGNFTTDEVKNKWIDMFLKNSNIISKKKGKIQ